MSDTEQYRSDLMGEVVGLKQIGASHADLINAHTINIEELAKKMKSAMDQQAMMLGRQIEIAMMGSSKGTKTIGVQENSVDRKV